MQLAFWGLAVASVLHAAEEYVYPGGFLRWLRLVFPRGGLGAVGATIVNGAFFALVLSPLVSMPRETPVFSLSVAGLLLANGSLHVAGTFLTGHYSPGAVTSILCYFPAALFALVVLTAGWHLTTWQVGQALLLGIAWQAIPLAFLIYRLRA